MTIYVDLETTAVPSKGLPEALHFAVVAMDDDDPFVCMSDNELAEVFSRTKGPVIFHKGITFDVPVLRKFWPMSARIIDKDKNRVLDTLIVSKLLKNTASSHSLGSLTKDSPHPKMSPPSSWDILTPHMIEYALGDIKSTRWLWKSLKRHAWCSDSKEPLRTEHNFQWFLNDTLTGYRFAVEDAKKLLEDMKTLRRSFDFSELGQTKVITRQVGKFLKSGEVSKRYHEYISDGWIETRYDEETGKAWITLIQRTPFNPLSAKQRIDAILDNGGWNPVDKTDGHKNAVRKKLDEEKLEHFKRYGWTMSERNLETISEEAPECIKNIGRYLTLDSRIKMVELYLKTVDDEGIIKCDMSTLGAWTGRCSHARPNLGNPVSCWPEDKPVKTPVDEIKQAFDTRIRGLFRSVHPDGLMLGFDAKGIQLRILGHYMNDPEFTKELLDGDIHQKNADILESDRDTSKTFIYAWILNAGLEELARILSCSTAEAKDKKEAFEKSWAGLKNLDKLIDVTADRGYFIGLDGRRVSVPSKHHVKAALLQNGEAVVMKKVGLYLSEWLDTDRFREISIMSFTHDEYQFAGPRGQLVEFGKRGAAIISAVGQALELNVPLEGALSDIGTSWAETH